MTLREMATYLAVGFLIGGLFTLLSGCVMISKDITYNDSDNNKTEYTTRSETYADVRDLVDAEVKIPLIP